MPTKLESFLSVAKSLIVRGLIIYAISSFFKSPKAPAATTNLSQSGPTIQARNIFPDGAPLSLYVFLSESEKLQPNADLFWSRNDLSYADWTAGENRDGIFEFEKNVTITSHMKNNGSLFLHAFVTQSGVSPFIGSTGFNNDLITSTVKQLNRLEQFFMINFTNHHRHCV